LIQHGAEPFHTLVLIQRTPPALDGNNQRNRLWLRFVHAHLLLNAIVFNNEVCHLCFPEFITAELCFAVSLTNAVRVTRVPFPSGWIADRLCLYNRTDERRIAPMKTSAFCSLILCVSLTAAAQVTPKKASAAGPSVIHAAEQKAVENQKEIDAITAELKATFPQETDISGQLTALEKSDAELKKSDQAQVDTSHMVEKQLNKLKNETLPAIQARANAWDVKRQNHINGGCPAEGGRMPVDQANRCNAETDALMAERGRIFADAESATKERAQYEQLRDAVTATTLSNAAKEKANNAQRDALNTQKSQLEATKKRLEAKLEDLKKGIDSCAKVLSQRGVSCETIKARCGNIQFDGSDPDLRASAYDAPCGAPLAGKPKTAGVTANK
jgi:hypothetical protein